jgi:hypothetical protein
VRDFEPNLLFNLGGHVMNLPENRTIDNSASRRRIETKGGSVGHYPQRPVNFFEQKFSYLDASGPVAVAGRIATKKTTATRRIQFKKRRQQFVRFDDESAAIATICIDYPAPPVWRHGAAIAP